MIQQIPVCRFGICIQAAFAWRTSAFSVASVIEHQNRRAYRGDFSDLQKAVGDVPRIPMQIQCDERSLWHRNPPGVKPEAVRGEQPDILGSESALQFPNSAWILERVKGSAARSHKENADAECNYNRHADVPWNLHAEASVDRFSRSGDSRGGVVARAYDQTVRTRTDDLQHIRFAR